MSSVVKQSRAYTPVEREFFLGLLNEHKDVIENKKTDAASNKMKENAWKVIADCYNSSSSITQERSVPQLKKWWSNIKQGHRDAKTKERQARLGTGGGPETDVSKEDPLVEVIAPHLMVQAPVIFSSNLTTADIEKGIAAIDNGSMEVIVMPDAETQDNDSEAASLIMNQDIGIDSLPANTDTEMSDQSSSKGQKSNPPPSTNNNSFPQICAPMKRKRTRVSISSSSCTSGDSSKNSLESHAKVERIKIITENEMELHQLKLSQEKEMYEEKRLHLRRLYDLEERAALAKALLAEVELAAAKQKYGL